MIDNRKEAGSIRDYRAAVVCGFISAAFLIVLLLVSSFLCEKFKLLFLRREVTANVSLALSAVSCGFLAAKRMKGKRFLYALLGEGVILLMLLMTGLFIGFPIGWIPLLIDAGIMLFGAFAGTSLPLNTGKQRRGKR